MQCPTSYQYINYRGHYLGMDSPRSCQDPQWFRQYPLAIDYSFNSHGVRDREWPQDLCDRNWALGCSFTVGQGVPIELTWVRQLEQLIGQPILNLSVNGASNDWIRSRAQVVLSGYRPRALFIHWSYIHRRMDLRGRNLHHTRVTHADDLANFTGNLEAVQNARAGCRIYHSAISQWLPNDSLFRTEVQRAISQFDSLLWADPVLSLDLARDGHHYGPETGLAVAENYQRLISAR